MYRIIGADGKEYGPVSADQLRQWMAAGRVNHATRVQQEGTTEWKPLGEFPEFAAAAPAGAAFGPPVISQQAGPHQFTKFPVAAAILLHYLTFGIFTFIWLNLMHGKLPRVRPDDPSAGRAVGFCFIPFFNLYWIFFTYRRLCVRVDEQRELYGLAPSKLKGIATTACIFQVIPYINVLIGLTIVVPIFLGMMQSSVNQLAAASATTAPKGSLPAAAAAAGLSGPAIVGIVCGFLAIPVLAALLLPALGAARQKAQMAACMSNVRQIGLAMQLYASDYGGKPPQSLDDLVRTGIVSTNRIFYCPAVTDRTHYSYTFTDAITFWGDTSTNVIVLQEIDENHRRGRVVLYNDGHAAWLRDESSGP